MTHSFNGITLFCDDLREEANKMNTLVGVYSDNVRVDTAPFAFAKLGLYTRLLVTPDFIIEPIEIFLISEDQENLITTMSAELVEKSVTDAKHEGAHTGGLISRAMYAPFPVEKATRFRVIAKTKSYQLETGTLNVMIQPQEVVTAPTEPSPHSGRSRRASRKS